MSGERGPAGVAWLFISTVGRRLVLALVTTVPPEAMDAEGTYRTVVFKRPPREEAQAFGDYDAVRADLIRCGHIKTFRTEWVFVGVAFAFAIVLMTNGSGGLPWRLSMAIVVLPLLLVTLIAAGFRTHRRATRLDSKEEFLTAAWMRQGCCPHCLYRLPERAAGPTVRCTECGVAWRAPGDPL